MPGRTSSRTSGPAPRTSSATPTLPHALAVARSSLAELSSREQIIIRERRLREEGSTLEELGVQLGISKERVRQIEHRALQKLKAALMRRVKDPVETDLFTAGRHVRGPLGAVDGACSARP